MSERHEMGWNDVIGNLARAASHTKDEKLAFCEKLKAGQIWLPVSDPDYIQGTKDAADAFINGGPLEYKGPQWVKDALSTRI